MFNAHVLGNNIRKYRIAKGLSQTDIADILNISPQSVSKWECGISTPDIEKICLMADFFNVSLDTFLGNSKEDKKIMIGVDGGGTKTEFVMFTEDGNIIERIVLGACNPNAIGIKNSCEILKNGINELLSINPDVCGIHIGSSGFLIGDNGKEIQKVLAKAYPNIKLSCKTDIMNVISSCTEHEKCIAVICGTGSVVYIKNKEQLTRLTGWGYLLSKSGSGFDIGRDALYYALRDKEGLGDKTLITEIVEVKLGDSVGNCIAEVYKLDQSYIASFAPAVFAAYKKGDLVAKQILSENAEALAYVINHTSEKYGITKNIILSGGLITNNKIFAEILNKKLNKDIEYVIPKCPQVYGACVLCAKMCGINAENLVYNFMKQYDKKL